MSDDGDDPGTGTDASTDLADRERPEPTGDGDRILNLVGVALVGFLVFGLSALVLAGAFAAGGGGTTPNLPQANWTAERINDTHVRLVHAGGEPVQADDLIVVVGKTDRGIRTQDRLVNGESIVVAAQTDRSVSLYWKPEDRQRRALLREWERIDPSG